MVTERSNGELIRERTARIAMDGGTRWSTDGQLVDLGDGSPRGVALVSRDAGRLVALDPDTGEDRWSVAGGVRPRRTVDDLLVVTEGSNLRGLDLADGSVRWSAFIASEQDRVSSVVAGRSQVYVAEGGRIEAVDAATGERRWGLSLGDRFVTLRRLGERLVAQDGGTGIGLETRR